VVAGQIRAFLEGTPDAPDRGAIERRIESLLRQIREREALRQKQREAESKPPPSTETETDATRDGSESHAVVLIEERMKTERLS